MAAKKRASTKPKTAPAVDTQNAEPSGIASLLKHAAERLYVQNAARTQPSDAEFAALLNYAAERLTTAAVGKGKGEVKRATKPAEKPKTKQERIRAQRLKFCTPRRKNGTPWTEIYNDYNKKYPADRKASAATLRLTFERNPDK